MYGIKTCDGFRRRRNVNQFSFQPKQPLVDVETLEGYKEESLTEKKWIMKEA